MPTETVEKHYRGRREDVVVVNLSILRDTYHRLKLLGGGRKMGALIDRLVGEHCAREAMRQEIAQEILAKR